MLTELRSTLIPKDEYQSNSGTDVIYSLCNKGTTSVGPMKPAKSKSGFSPCGVPFRRNDLFPLCIPMCQSKIDIHSAEMPLLFHPRVMEPQLLVPNMAWRSVSVLHGKTGLHPADYNWIALSEELQ